MNKVLYYILEVNIDDYLNRITMYRLVEYLLIFLVILAVILASFRLLPYSPVKILESTIFILAVCKVSNVVLAKIFKTPTNVESVYITAFILALIVSPNAGWGMLLGVSVLAMASKYILSLNGKHIFNPAAIAVVLTALIFGWRATWWVDNTYMAIPLILSGFLIVRKIKRECLVISFLFTVFLLTLWIGSLSNILLDSALFFFTGIMLTEPLTSPTTRKWQIVFGVVVGFLFVPQMHIGKVYFTPELALVIGNIFAFLVTPRQRLRLTLKEKIQLTPDTYDFVFTPNKKINFIPGQYMEWTLAHHQTDDRGNRRYFTLASSPTEDGLRIGVKFHANGSSYKKALLEMISTPIVAGQLAGDFTLPKDVNKKYVFMAGGIGITPFRSMIKYLIDTNQKRDIVLLYANKNDGEICYRDVFDQAPIKLIYHNTDVSGHFDQNNLPQLVPDYKERYFYISGPHGMVSASEKLLKYLKVKDSKIKTDYFPGY